MAGDEPWTLEPVPLLGLRLGVAQGLPLRGLDQTVSARFNAATKELDGAGVRLSNEAIPLCDDIARVKQGDVRVGRSSWSIHREWLATRSADYDPFVRPRIEARADLSAAEYIDMIRERTVLVRAMDARLANLDAIMMPTTPIVAPTMAEVSSSEGSSQECTSFAILRSPISSISARFLFRCLAPAGCRLA